MKTFQEWLKNKNLNEGRPADWAPSPRMHNDALASAIKKVQMGDKAGEMPYTGNFAGIDPIQTRLGLDDEELQALKNARLIAKSADGGYNVLKVPLPPPAPQRQAVSQPSSSPSGVESEEAGLWRANGPLTRLGYLSSIPNAKQLGLHMMSWEQLSPEAQQAARKEMNSKSPFG
jgi:hypothetical protein